MAQADGIVSNGSGAAVRADINNQLAAVFTNHSGATEPTTTYAFQFWADTTNGLLKIRNSLNTAWVTLRQLDGEFDTLPVENGTAGAPSIFFRASGTDTGFFSPGTDQVGIATGGASCVVASTTGISVTGSISDTNGNIRAIPQNAKTAAYTLIASDLGKHISITTGGITVPASVFSVGDAVTIFNNSASNQTITQGASVTLHFAGTANTGNRTLAQRGIATILCVASNTFVISGAGLT